MRYITTGDFFDEHFGLGRVYSVFGSLLYPRHGHHARRHRKGGQRGDGWHPRPRVLHHRHVRPVPALRTPGRAAGRRMDGFRSRPVHHCTLVHSLALHARPDRRVQQDARPPARKSLQPRHPRRSARKLRPDHRVVRRHPDDQHHLQHPQTAALHGNWRVR